MAYRRIVGSTSRVDCSRGRLRNVLTVVLLTSVIVTVTVGTCLADGQPSTEKPDKQSKQPVKQPDKQTDLEAFRAAKQAYFKRPKKAVGLFRAFLKQHHDSKWTPQAYYWLAKSLEAARAGRSEVIKAYTLFLRSYPNHDLSGEATFAIAEIYHSRRWNKSDLNRALERYLKFVKSYPNNDRLPEAYFKIGDVRLTLKQYDKARDAFSRVVDDFSDSSFVTPAQIGKAQCLYLTKKYDEAVAIYKKLLKSSLRNWDLVKVHLGLMNCYLDTNKLELALAEADCARRKIDDDKQNRRRDMAVFYSYQRVAAYYQRTKQYPKAVTEMQTYMERCPKSSGVWSAWITIGDIYMSANQFEEARTALGKIILEHPSAQAGKKLSQQVLYVRYRIGYTYEREKNYKAAISEYELLSREHPDSRWAKAGKKRVEQLKKKLKEKPAEPKPTPQKKK